jgi:trigger factor
MNDAGEFVYRLIVPLPPQVTLGPYKGLPFERRQLVVGDREVDEQIQTILERNATYNDVTERDVKMGDILVGDLQVVIEGMDVSDLSEPQRTAIEVGKNIPDFDNALVGMKVGDNKVIKATYPADFAEPEMQGKKATFTVDLKEIHERVLPELTEEFVGQVHRTAKNADELRAEMLKSLEEASTQMADNDIEVRLVSELVKTATIHFPRYLLQAEMNAAANQLMASLEENKTTFEQYLMQTGQTQEQLSGEMATAASLRIQNSLVLSEVAKSEGITLEDADMEVRFAARAEQVGASSSAVRAYYEQNEQMLNQLRDQVLTEKILTHLKSLNTIKERKLTPDEMQKEVEAEQKAQQVASAIIPAVEGEAKPKATKSKAKKAEGEEVEATTEVVAEAAETSIEAATPAITESAPKKRAPKKTAE